MYSLQIARPQTLKAALIVAAALATTTPVMAHQTFMISDLAVIKPGTDNFLLLRNGSYHEAGYSITRKMSQDISIVMAGQRKTPPDDEVVDVDARPTYKDTFIKVFAEKPGTGLAGLSTIPDYIALPAVMFEEYLEHEGMTDALAEFRKTNKLGTIRERYTKNAKGLFQVGTPLTEDFKFKLGYKAEIVLEQNPGTLKAGDDASIQVFFDGKPLKNQLVYISHAKREVPPKALIPEASLYGLRTDDSGRVVFKITAKDKWFVQLIHMQKIVDEDADYESNWSTITFEVTR
jgi:Domain of unknown function (DUF4198)